MSHTHSSRLYNKFLFMVIQPIYVQCVGINAICKHLILIDIYDLKLNNKATVMIEDVLLVSPLAKVLENN